jgi:short-subunit dehydrogenase
VKTLENKIVVITGAGSGFGRALAIEAGVRKAIPVLLDISREGLQQTSDMLHTSGVRFASHALDVRDAVQWQTVATAVIAQFGHVDVLINNAGVLSRAESFLETTEEHARFVFDVNVWGMFNGMRAFAPHLARRPEANIVNLSSSLALIGTPMHAVYCASKAAIAQMSSVVRQELAGTGVTVSVVYPGPSKTNLGRNVSADSVAQREENATNFEKFAVTSAETVARRILNAVRKNRTSVTTSADAKLMHLLQRLSPAVGNRLMGLIYRKVSDPKLFTRLDQLGVEAQRRA